MPYMVNSGAKPWTPQSFGSALTWWVDGSHISRHYTDSTYATAVTSDADRIGGTRDKSTAGNDSNQATAGFRPTYKTAIQNGRSVIRLNGTDQYHVGSANDLSTAAGFSVFVAWAPSVHSAAVYPHIGQLYCNAAISNRFVFGTNNDGGGVPYEDVFFGHPATNHRFVNASIGANVWNQLSIICDAGTYTAWLNGTAQTLLATGGFGANQNQNVLFARDASPTGITSYFQGDLGELVVVNRPATSAERLACEAYQKNGWSTP